MAIDNAAGRRLRKIRPEEAWKAIEDLAQYKEEEWNETIFSKKGCPDYIDANFEHELKNMERRVESLENKLEYEDEDEVKIKMMRTGMDKESLERNLYENDITFLICHNFSLTLNPPIKPKDS
nr:hypothetical protein [Tanacetum cinerariifolium]